MKIKNLSDYMNRSLTNKACEELVPMLQEMFAELWEPLEHPKAVDGGCDQVEGNTLRRWVHLVTVCHFANGVGGWPQSGGVEEVIDNRVPTTR